MNINKLSDSTVVVASKADLIEAIQTVLASANKETTGDNEITQARYITIDDVATLTGYKRPTLYRFVALKQIPHYKRKGRICFKMSEINAWMEEGKCTV